jgi:hypothetical protein
MKKATNQTSSATSDRYRSAEIVFEECACDAVMTISGTRFLVNDVPRIPVSDCTLPNCKCSYVRYNDRRSWTEERRALFSLRTKVYAASSDEERRKKSDRRVDEGPLVESPEEGHDFKKWGL